MGAMLTPQKVLHFVYACVKSEGLLRVNLRTATRKKARRKQAASAPHSIQACSWGGD